VLDGGEGAEKQAGGVGNDGGAARGDAILGEQDEQLGEDLVDVGGGGELGELADQVRGEVGDFKALKVKLGMAEAEAGVGVDNAEAAAAS
jgi:hypothetical protein